MEGYYPWLRVAENKIIDWIGRGSVVIDIEELLSTIKTYGAYLIACVVFYLSKISEMKK